MTNTPMPNDYLLSVHLPFSVLVVSAELVIEPLPDGTFDVRGRASHWLFVPGAFTVESVGTAKFVPPGS